MPNPLPAAPLALPALPAPLAAPALPAPPTAGDLPALHPVDPVTPHLYVPCAQRPVRAKRSTLATTQQVVPHQHGWAQLAFSLSGVTRLTVADGAYLVPPSRALWIPAGVTHAVTVLEDSTLLTLYLHQPGYSGPGGPGGPGAAGAQDSPGGSDADQAPWRQCRVLAVSDLLRALVLQMDIQPDPPPGLPPHGPADPPPGALPSPTLAREALLSALVLDELRRAAPVRLGIALPRDKRLRSLCEAVIAQPARHATLAGWAGNVGASPRTLARLFRDQLGTSFGPWRQQELLAQALALAARGRPVTLIAAELGYASASAFTAMVRRAVGQPPSRFFASAAAPVRASATAPGSAKTAQVAARPGR